MKQILQNLANDQTELVNIPCPQVKSGHLLIHTIQTLVSAGTERMLVEFGKANYLDKARRQPDKVKMVLDKVKTDGLLSTLEAVRSKLDQPLPLGYCNIGMVMEIGAGEGFQVGDRVVSNGRHAEVVNVPKNLCTKIPDGVSDEVAAFTVLGAIALQGVRLAQPTLGEAMVVTFRSVGIRAIPAPTDFEVVDVSEETLLSWLPDAGALEGSSRAVKEGLEILVLRFCSRAWLPGRSAHHRVQTTIMGEMPATSCTTWPTATSPALRNVWR